MNGFQLRPGLIRVIFGSHQGPKSNIRLPLQDEATHKCFAKGYLERDSGPFGCLRVPICHSRSPLWHFHVLLRPTLLVYLLFILLIWKKWPQIRALEEYKYLSVYADKHLYKKTIQYILGMEIYLDGQMTFNIDR